LALPFGLHFLYNKKMNQSINVKQKKRGRPATGKTPITGVRLPDDLAEAVDSAGNDEADNPTRSETIRRILRDWLIGNGYLKEHDLKKFVQTTSGYSSEVKRFAVVADIDRFESVHPTGWKEVEFDLDAELNETSFSDVVTAARKNGFEVVQL